MIVEFVLFSFLLLLLFLLAGRITNNVFTIVYLVTKSNRLGVYVVAVCFIIGTTIHELAHLIMAMIVRVPAGNLTIIPHVQPDGQIRAGSVHINKTDPFRYMLIGLAPMFIGLGLVYVIGSFWFPLPLLYSYLTFDIWHISGWFLLSMITTTMFSSKKDLESLAITGPIIVGLIILCQYIGIRISLSPTLTDGLQLFLTKETIYLGIGAIINLTLFFVLSFLLFLVKKVSLRQ